MFSEGALCGPRGSRCPQALSPVGTAGRRAIGTRQLSRGPVVGVGGSCAAPAQPRGRSSHVVTAPPASLAPRALAQDLRAPQASLARDAPRSCLRPSKPLVTSLRGAGGALPAASQPAGPGPGSPSGSWRSRCPSQSLPSDVRPRVMSPPLPFPPAGAPAPRLIRVLAPSSLAAQGILSPNPPQGPMQRPPDTPPLTVNSHLPGRGHLAVCPCPWPWLSKFLLNPLDYY